MTKNVPPVPPGMHTVTPILVLERCAEAIEFYKKAFHAEELMRFPGQDGKSVAHAEIRIGDSILYMADAMPQFPAFSSSLAIYVEDCDTVFDRAVSAGARVLRPMADQFYGDRAGQIEDPFGQRWSIATHKEDLSMDEIHERMKKAMSGS